MSNKNIIYQDAMSIEKNSVNTPKFKRIRDYVSRVFGVDDPPPGLYIYIYIYILIIYRERSCPV